MKLLRVRLTLWFTISFVVLMSGLMVWTYRNLSRHLQEEKFLREREDKPHRLLRGSYSEREVQDIMGELAGSVLLVTVPAVLVILMIGFFVGRLSLHPIEHLNRQLEAIDRHTLGRQLELPAGDRQFRSLLRYLNEMLARLDRSFGEMGEYAAKVAHELRTPLTIIRHKLEQSQGRIEPELAEELQEELLRLTHVVEQSLLIAKAGQERLHWNTERFDLGTTLAEMVEDFSLVAAADHRKLELRSEPTCLVETDRNFCRQMLQALFSNALIHGRGDIMVRLRQRGGRVRFLLVNRLRAAPTSSELTLGLGLRVVKALVSQQPSIEFRKHHGGRLYATSLTFPVAPADESKPLRLEAPEKRDLQAGG